jgi:hypothetical protein
MSVKVPSVSLHSSNCISLGVLVVDFELRTLSFGFGFEGPLSTDSDIRPLLLIENADLTLRLISLFRDNGPPNSLSINKYNA